MDEQRLGQIISINQAALFATGYQRSELFGKSVNQIVPNFLLPYHDEILKKYLGKYNRKYEILLLYQSKEKGRRVLLPLKKKVVSATQARCAITHTLSFLSLSLSLSVRSLKITLTEP